MAMLAEVQQHFALPIDIHPLPARSGINRTQVAIRQESGKARLEIAQPIERGITKGLSGHVVRGFIDKLAPCPQSSKDDLVITLANPGQDRFSQPCANESFALFH